MTKPYMNPEPVPPASQLSVLPFAAAVDGLLRGESEIPSLRVTLHRAISRQGEGYLQQVCAYVQGEKADPRGAGRVFPVDEGIIGAAFGDRRIWRTKAYKTNPEFQIDLREAMPASGDKRAPSEVAWSYLAVPFLGPQDQVVLILYADCNELNFFANDDRLRCVVAMCRGFCCLFDWLEKNDPFPNLRNFPLQKGKPITGSDRTVYSKIQEAVDFIEPPRFKEVPSFNYEASAA